MTSTNDCNGNVSHSSNDCNLLVYVHIVFLSFFKKIIHLYVVHCAFLVMFFFPILGISPSGPFYTLYGAHGASRLSSGSLLWLHF
jgi:hypothetical protein